MLRFLKPDTVLGLLVTLFALVLLFLWIPNDIDGDLINIVRRRASIGDPLAPTLTGYLLLLCGVMLTGTSLFRPAGSEGVSLRNFVFVLLAAVFLMVFVAVMLYAGPLAVSLFAGGEEYRLLRSRLPWKYLGYLLGGFLLMIAVISVIERRVSPRTILLAVVVPLAIALFYDLPFDDVLLPPNGDF